VHTALERIQRLAVSALSLQGEAQTEEVFRQALGVGAVVALETMYGIQEWL
jgi:hypothetical protein